MGEVGARDRLLPVGRGLAALAILVPLMIPVLSLTLGQQDIGALSSSTTARQAYDQISENFGQGVNGPLLIAVKLGPAGAATRVDLGHSSRLATALRPCCRRTSKP